MKAFRSECPDSDKSRVAVTGATGFVGRHLVECLWRDKSVQPVGFTRGPKPDAPQIEWHSIRDINQSQWDRALQNVNVVFHLAATAHAYGVAPKDVHEINVAGTLAVASGALEAGVRQFVFMSSIKAQGENSGQECFTEDGVASPVDVYGEAKLEAERELQKLFRRSSCSLSIIRSPLVYGPGVRANFLALIRAVDRGLPLPFSSIHNRRSMIYVENLVDALVTVSRGTGGLYLVSDQHDLSTPDLIREIASHLRRKPRIFPLPPVILRVLFGAMKRSGTSRRLLDDLCVSTDRMQLDHQWVAPFTVSEGIARTVEWYSRSQR